MNRIIITMLTFALTISLSRTSLGTPPLIQPTLKLRPADLGVNDQYEYLYTHLLHPASISEHFFSVASYEAKCLAAASLLGISTAWIATSYLSHNNSTSAAIDKQKLFETKKNKFVQKLNKLNKRYGGSKKLKQQGQPPHQEAEIIKKEETQPTISTKTVLLSLALTAGYYWTIKRFFMSNPTLYADRFTDFLANWPLHMPQVSPHLHNYFNELHQLHTHSQGRWTLREDVAQACLEMLAQVA